MPSTPTTRGRVEKQGQGENLNTWGDTRLNSAFDRFDEMIAGVLAKTLTQAATTLTSQNYIADESRYACLVLSGTLTANSTVTVPGVEKLYLIVNGTVQGNYTLTIKTAAGTGYQLRPGPQWVYCDGIDVRRGAPRLDELPAPTSAVNANSQRIIGLAAPSAVTDAANREYVDAGDAATVAQVSGLIATAQAAALEATTAGAAATNAAADVQQQVAELAELLQDGPVASVNGMGGAVVLTAADVGAAPAAHTHDEATTSAAGFMSATDKLKLNGAASTSTANAIVRRDANGDFSAGTVTAALAGNASTAGALAAGSDKTKLDSAVQSVNSKTGTSISLTAADVAAAPRQFTARTTTTAAVVGDRIAANTSGGAWTLTLPASPATGALVEIMDGAGTFGTNALTVARNAQTIMGLAEDMTVNTANASFILVFTGSTWRLA